MPHKCVHIYFRQDRRIAPFPPSLHAGSSLHSFLTSSSSSSCFHLQGEEEEGRKPHQSTITPLFSTSPSMHLLLSFFVCTGCLPPYLPREEEGEDRISTKLRWPPLPLFAERGRERKPGEISSALRLERRDSPGDVGGGGGGGGQPSDRRPMLLLSLLRGCRDRLHPPRIGRLAFSLSEAEATAITRERESPSLPPYSSPQVTRTTGASWEVGGKGM